MSFSFCYAHGKTMTSPFAEMNADPQVQVLSVQHSRGRKAMLKFGTFSKHLSSFNTA